MIFLFDLFTLAANGRFNSVISAPHRGNLSAQYPLPSPTCFDLKIKAPRVRHLTTRPLGSTHDKTLILAVNGVSSGNHKPHYLILQ